MADVHKRLLNESINESMHEGMNEEVNPHPILGPRAALSPIPTPEDLGASHRHNHRNFIYKHKAGAGGGWEGGQWQGWKSPTSAPASRR